MDANEFIEDALNKDPDLKRGIFTKELKKYFKKYVELSKKYSDFKVDLSNIHHLPSTDVPKFVNLLVESVMSSLAPKHAIIVDVKNTDGYNDILIATHRGIKTRSYYGTISRDLTGKDILNMFVNHSSQVEGWISKNKPAKLSDFLSIKQAFLNGYQNGFCKAKDNYYTRQSKGMYYDISRVVPDINVGIINENKYSDDLIDIKDFTVSKVVARYSIEENSFDIYLLDKNDYSSKDKEFKGSGVHKFSHQDALENIELRQIIPIIDQVLDDAAKHRDAKIAELRSWFNTFKASQNKWVSIMNI